MGFVETLPPVSRRGFLKLLSAGLAGTASFSPEGVNMQNKFSRVFDVFLDQPDEWKEAELSNEAFVERNGEKLKNMDISFSFSPEQLYGLSASNYKTEEGKRLTEKSVEALKFIHKELGADEVRLGVRWDNAVDENGNFDFGFYKPYFDYCIQNGLNICLNIGIKVFRWPEDHVPPMYKDIMPADKSVIGMESPLSAAYLKFADSMMHHLISSYSKRELETITKIQPENEAFHSFGQHGWTMGNDYLTTLVEHIDKFLPGRKILFNSSEYTNLPQISELFKILSDFIDKKRLVPAINYYPFCYPGPDSPSFYQLLSLIPGNVTLGTLRDRGYAPLEMSEIQAEQWLNRPLPRDWATSIKYITLRSINDILANQQSSVLSYWGIESLLQADPKLSAPVFDLFVKMREDKLKRSENKKLL